ncbi:MAG: rhomboid family intramembrane serine protease [Armatimonadia bacterium]|nr:rhomboid family intramembrane serine protease [Armatimonadia bacterium]
MLIPYATARRRHRTPWVTFGIIAINVLVYLYCLTLGPDGFAEFAGRWGFEGLAPEGYYRLLTMVWIHDPRSFLHLHIIGNMWALAVFGPQVEDALGHIIYGAYYLLGGIVSGLAHALICAWTGLAGGPEMIGASGAVLCVLGMFAVRFYSTPVKTVLVVIPGIRIPAVIYLAIYLGLDLRAGIIGSFAERTVGGVAHWAHIGGFVFGAAAGLLHGVVRHARREYLLERPVESPDDRSERIPALRSLIRRNPADAEARLRLATLLDAEEATLPAAAEHYREAIDELLRSERPERAIAAFDALEEGGHSPGLITARSVPLLATALERAGRPADALRLLDHLARREGLDETTLEQALMGVAVLARDQGDGQRARWALERLVSELPFAPSVAWARRLLGGQG